MTTVLEKENLERDMTAEMKMRLETDSLGLKNELDRSAASSLYSRVCKGLSIDIVNKILHNAQYIFDVHFLLDRCGILDFQTAVMVFDFQRYLGTLMKTFYFLMKYCHNQLMLTQVSIYKKP